MNILPRKVTPLAIALALVSTGGCSSDSSAPVRDPFPALKVEAHLSGGALLQLKNIDSMTWENCDLGLNPHDSSRGYTRALRILHPGESMRFDVTDFTDGDGRRFDPAQQIVKYFQINCTTPDLGTFTGSFQ